MDLVRMFAWNRTSPPLKILAQFTLILLLVLVFNIRNTIGQSKFENTVKIKQEISLEGVIGRIPSITVDKYGNFIVINRRKGNINIYDKDGKSLITFGRKGRGPGEFSQPIAAIRLNSGKLLIAEFQGKLSLFNSMGDSLIKVYKVELLPLTEIHQINDNKILLVGQNRSVEKQKLLHIFDLSKGRITKSFLKLPFSLQDYGGIFHSIAKLATADVKDGKIVAVLTPFTRVKIFTIKGRLLKSIDLVFEHFKKIKNVNLLSPRELDEFITTFSMISNIFWFHDNTFLVDYYRLTEFERYKGFVSENNLVKVKNDGRILFELIDVPDLRVIHNENLYFKTIDFKNEVDLLEATVIKD